MVTLIQIAGPQLRVVERRRPGEGRVVAAVLLRSLSKPMILLFDDLGRNKGLDLGRNGISILGGTRATEVDDHDLFFTKPMCLEQRYRTGGNENTPAGFKKYSPHVDKEDLSALPFLLKRWL